MTNANSILTSERTTKIKVMDNRILLKLLTLESKLCAKGAKGRKQLRGLCASRVDPEGNNYIQNVAITFQSSYYAMNVATTLAMYQLHSSFVYPHFVFQNVMACCRHGITA